ncbi:MAG: diphosphomevalonate decarboxylase [Rhodobacteraceae bacterium]|nr:diphosphomevalonate decarboxylase [Paracoccaceae bacterium]
MIFDRLLPPPGPPQAAQARAPGNIALAKYWGKRDPALNLPCNSSLSVSLRDWGSITRVAPAPDRQDAVWLNGERLPGTSPFAMKALAFAGRFRRGLDAPLHIRTTNTIPTAAGLASSASGFAALTKALCAAFGADLDPAGQSQLARIGSGSACRSLWHGFVRWDRGRAPDGADSHGYPLPDIWPGFRIAVIPVDIGPKAHPSRAGMNRTVATSPLYASWPERAEADCADVRAAIEARDLRTLGETAEANALAMHATMLAARPALIYLKPQTWVVLETLWRARADGLVAYATMDAGANVKLIFLENAARDVQAAFPPARVIAPFDPP